MIDDGTRRTALRVLRLIDLTTLHASDDAARVAALARQATTPHGPVAALCILPAFVADARGALQGAGVRVATVSNFPHGTAGPEATRAEIEAARAAGADEIDVVVPYRAFMESDRAAAAELLAAARAATRAGVLKVILETGALADPALIRAAAELALAHGADFLKTSTGKIAVGATPGAARILIEVIVAAGRPCGLKLSGGVRTLAQAAGYLHMHDDAFGPEAATPDRLRFGASSLLDEVLAAV
jgi:deoxyribose-phosphate aldolase